ncbi:MAG: PGF-CTERM sorting domain-containing protein, partial [Archaeoglobaceae archaeon]
AKIDVGEGPTRAEAVALFTVEKPKITSLNVPSTHVKGTDLVIEGTCNLAKSGEKADNATIAPQVENWAYLTIEDLAGNVVVNSTITSAATSYIDSGGKFRFKIDDFGKDLSTGYYKVTVMIDSGIKTDDETAIMEIVKPEIKLTADKYMATRGSTVTFTIDTNLKVNNPVVFKIENTEFCTGDPDCVAEKEYKVDVRGDVIIKLTVDTMAPLTDYKFRAEIPDLGVSDEVRVTVVKQELNLTAEKTVVVRGGDVRFTGSTTADVVYVYADEPGIFRIGSVDVAELPSDTILTGDQLKTAVVYPDSNDRLDFKVDVLVTHPEYGDVSPGTYYLYFYAPANVTNGVANQIDRASDAQAIVAVTVTDPKIVSVDIPSRIPYQGKVEVSILTAPGDRNNVEVTFKLEGSNIKARPDDFDLPTYQTPDANNYVNFTLDLSKYAEKKGETLEPGLYVFTVELRFTQELGGDEVDSKDVLVEVVPQTLDVEIQPAQPVVGDKITVTVSTNREGVSGYDHIWVTMVGTNYKSVQRVTLDSTGKGSVTFETVGLAPGTYKFYIRDTSGTVAEKTEVELVEDLYDLDPADPVARVYNAHDDLVVVRTIELLETAPTTTTTPTPTPTQTTTTVATTPTTTTTEVTTTTPTTTTTPGGGIPGFEAIFAIAGLLAVAYLLRRR